MNEYCQVIVFSDKAYNFIIDESFNKDPLETGGILLGHILDNGVWLVMEVLPPGPNSIFQIAYFEYDTDFVNYLAQSIASQYNIKLSLLGLWHRHPGSMDTFSRTDDETNRTYAELNGQGAISGLVNIDPNFRLTMYHVHPNNFSYTDIEIAVGNEIIPDQYFELKHFPQKGLNPSSPNNTCQQLAVINQLNDFFKPLSQIFSLDHEKNESNESPTRDKEIFRQEIKEIQELLPEIQIEEGGGVLSISFIHNNDWHLDLRYTTNYKGETSELRIYIENSKLTDFQSNQFLPHIIFDNNGNSFLNISEILTGRNVNGKNVIEQSIKWIEQYEKLLENKISIDDFKL